MRRRVVLALAVTALAGLAAVVAVVVARDRDGGGGMAFAPLRPPDRAATLPSLPRAVVGSCKRLAPARDVAVLCPRALPAGRWGVVHRTLRLGRCQYLVDLETRPAGSGTAFHALAGGRCGPWSLATTRGHRWPRTMPLARDLGLPGALPLRPGQTTRDQRWVRLAATRSPRLRVAGHPALLLRAAAYPRGGLHGGHVGVIWNQDGAGYALTLHYPGAHDDGELPHVLQVLRAARAMSLGDPTA